MGSVKSPDLTQVLNAHNHICSLNRQHPRELQGGVSAKISHSCQQLPDNVLTSLTPEAMGLGFQSSVRPCPQVKVQGLFQGQPFGCPS